MPRTLLDLANSMRALRNKIDAAASQAAASIALVIVNDLAYKTPVDTSTAISSWIVTLGSPSSLVGKAHFMGYRGSTYAQSAAKTVADAKAMLANKKPGQSIFITNNQHYIKKLNDGFSPQAPAGFVERATLLGRIKAKSYKLNLKA